MRVERDDPVVVAIVGVGPRGTYALGWLAGLVERLAPKRPLQVHLIEPLELGAGVVYATDQPDYILMNTVASQLTAFSDPSLDGHIEEFSGPSLHEWATTDDGIALDPNDYPPRALHGRYLAWAVKASIQKLREAGIGVTVHQTRVDEVVPVLNGRTGYDLYLADGTVVESEFTLLTVGNLASVSAEEDLSFFRSPYPTNTLLDDLAGASSVGIAGMGLTAIDIVTALTSGKGGKFTERNDGGLTYVPSGAEPSLFWWSRSGVPLQARAINQKGVFGRHIPQFLTIDAINELVMRYGRLDFRRHVLPLVISELAAAYRSAARSDSSTTDAEDIWRHLIELSPGLAAPCYESSRDYSEAVAEFAIADIEQARLGNLTSPSKAAADALRDIRDNLRYAVEFNRLTPDSQREFDTWFGPLNNRLAVGPPLRRAEEMVALVECGVLSLALGKNPKLHSKNERGSHAGPVVATSTCFREQVVIELDAVVLGRVPRRASSMVERMLLRRIARQASNELGDSSYRLTTAEVTRNGYLVRGDGHADPRMTVLGSLAEGTVWYTQVSARPQVNSRSLQETRDWATGIVEHLVANVE